MKGQARINFSYLFPRLSAGGEHFDDYRKVNGVLVSFIAPGLKKEVAETTIIDFLNERGELKLEFIAHFEGRYKKSSTKSSQHSILTTLVQLELAKMGEDRGVSPAAARCGRIDPEKLELHMRQIWLALPRAGGAARAARDNRPREELAIKPLAVEVFALLLEVNEELGLGDAEALLKGSRLQVLEKIRTNISHATRTIAMKMLVRLRRNLGISGRDEPVCLTVEDLPEAFAAELNTFEERAQLGMGAFKDLRALAAKYDFTSIAPLAPTTLRSYKWSLLKGLSKIDLPEDFCVEDLLRLQERSVKTEDGELVVELYNPLVDQYREVEKAKVKPRVKAAGKDTSTFVMFTQSLQCVARYNGKFRLAATFGEHYTLYLDFDSRNSRKSQKKQRWPRKWIDEQIRGLKERFDKIVKKRSFLVSETDLRLCLYLPQLVVLRYFGFRQQCLRKCAVERNIFFNADGSITFKYTRYEIKNQVEIYQEVSEELHGNVAELMILLDVLTKYYSVVLKAVRAKDPEFYRKHVGDAFFVAPAGPGGEGLVIRYPADGYTGSYLSRAQAEVTGTKVLRDFFTTATYAFIDFASFKDFPEEFHPHFLRGVCCDWMYTDLEMTWREIEQAMGDREATLKKFYYEEGQRRQSATSPFARVSRDRGREAEALRLREQSIPLDVHLKTQQALENTTAVLSAEVARRGELEGEVKLLRMQRDFLVTRSGLTERELSDLIETGALSLGV